MVSIELILVNFDANPWPRWDTPVRSVSNRYSVRDDVVRHEMSGLLITVNDVGKSQKNVVAGGRRDS